MRQLGDGHAMLAVLAALMGGTALHWFVTDASAHASMARTLAVALQLCVAMLAMAWITWQVLQERQED